MDRALEDIGWLTQMVTVKHVATLGRSVPQSVNLAVVNRPKDGSLKSLGYYVSQGW